MGVLGALTGKVEMMECGESRAGGSNMLVRE